MMLFNFDINLEEQRALHAWFTLQPDAQVFEKLHAALLKMKPEDRRITIKLEPDAAKAIEAVLTNARISATYDEGSHINNLHRILSYIRGMLRHELAKRGHMIPKHDPSVRRETGLTFKPRGDA